MYYALAFFVILFFEFVLTFLIEAKNSYFCSQLKKSRGVLLLKQIKPSKKYRKMNTFCKILFIGFIGQLGFAQNFDKVKLDNYFNALEINNKFMGSVAVAKNGVLIYSKAIGFSDLENAIKANVNTTYKIGSISKTFTAVLVLKAVEENKLKLHQTLDYYFPEVKNAEKITVEQLLTHRSGIHNFTDDFA